MPLSPTTEWILKAPPVAAKPSDGREGLATVSSYLCDMTQGSWPALGALPMSLIPEITECFILEVSSSKDGCPSGF